MKTETHEKKIAKITKELEYKSLLLKVEIIFFETITNPNLMCTKKYLS